MGRKVKVPSWVVHVESGQVLRVRRISVANARMKRDGWKGLVCHVQNQNGTGLVEYRKLRLPTAEELAKFNLEVKRRFGI
jgi:hypothetical protein